MKTLEIVRPSQRAMPRERSWLWTEYSALTVTVLATVLALVETQPLFMKLSSAIYADFTGDAVGAISIYWWWSYALRHGLSLFNNTLVGAPFGAGWDQVGFTVLQVAILAPLSVVVGPIAAYNLTTLASFPATALVTYWLARRLGFTLLASAFTALAFAFMPYHVEKAMGHLNQTHMELFPALLLFLVRWRQGGSRWNLVASGTVVGLTEWTDFYFTFIMAFLVPAFFVVSFLLSPQGQSIASRVVKHVAGLTIVGATASAFVPVAMLLVLRGTLRGNPSVILSNPGLHRSLSDIQVYSLRPWEFFLPWRSNPLLPQAVKTFELQHLHLSNFTEQSLFIGYTVLALAIIGVVAARQWFVIALGSALVVEGMILSLPPHIRFAGLHARGPSYLLNHVMPFFRVYSRFGVLALLGAALLAGLGLTWIQGRVAVGILRWVAFLPFVVLAVEFNNQPPPHVLTLLPGPQEYHWLRAQPAGTLVEYPLSAGNPGWQEVQAHQYMFYQQVHEHPLFNNDVPTSGSFQLAPKLEPYYGSGVAAQLQTLGIRYLFVHRKAYLEDGFGLPRAVEGMRFVGNFGDTDVFVLGGQK